MTKPGDFPNFSASPLSGDAPLEVYFTDLSTGERINAWAWDFDSDGNVDSTEQNSTWNYTKAGNYTVSLTVTNAGGSDNEIKVEDAKRKKAEKKDSLPVPDLMSEKLNQGISAGDDLNSDLETILSLGDDE